MKDWKITEEFLTHEDNGFSDTDKFGWKVMKCMFSWDGNIEDVFLSYCPLRKILCVSKEKNGYPYHGFEKVTTQQEFSKICYAFSRKDMTFVEPKEESVDSILLNEYPSISHQFKEHQEGLNSIFFQSIDKLAKDIRKLKKKAKKSKDNLFSFGDRVILKESAEGREKGQQLIFLKDDQGDRIPIKVVDTDGDDFWIKRGIIEHA